VRLTQSRPRHLPGQAEEVEEEEEEHISIVLLEFEALRGMGQKILWAKLTHMMYPLVLHGRMLPAEPIHQSQ